MKNVRKYEPAEFIADSFDQLSDGDVDRGNLSRGCYRVEVGGEHPTGCDLHVKREGDIIRYNCFSASCPCSGSVRVGKGTRNTNGTGGRPKPTERISRESWRVLEARRILRGSVRHLPKLCLEYLARNNISRADAENVGMLWNDAEKQIVIPISSSGVSEELLVRNIGEQSTTKKKWMNYVEPSTTYMSKSPVHSNILLIVEAPTSAISVSSSVHCDVLASLGTNFCDGKLKNIVDIASSYEKVLFIPDGDVEREKVREIKKRLTKAGINVTVKRVETKPRYELELIRRFIEEA